MRGQLFFPLSNPYDRAEAVPGDLIHWTDGRALVATGTEFRPAALKDRTIKIAQCNNFYIFPAIGLAVRASEAKRVTDLIVMGTKGRTGLKRLLLGSVASGVVTHASCPVLITG